MESIKYSHITNNDFPRVDYAIINYFNQKISRAQLKQRIQKLSINQKPAKLSHSVKQGDKIQFYLCDESDHRILPAPIIFSTIWENENIIVINKPQGLVVHPAAGHWQDTVVNGLLWRWYEHFKNKDWDVLRPGIVHRLDADTSGVLIIAKDTHTHAFLVDVFKRRVLQKIYFAIVKGVPRTQEGEIQSKIRRDPLHRKRFSVAITAGREALTRYQVLADNGQYSLVKFKPLTGRTHQIRLHAKLLGTPVLGDPLYARKDLQYPHATMQLHAYSLFCPIRQGGKKHRFIAELPIHMKDLLSLIGIDEEICVQ